jgi:hypothetical protein
MSDPRRLVSFPPERNWRQVRRVRLHQQSVPRHESEQIVIRPLVEGHDPAEGYVPTGIQSAFSKRVRAGVAVQDADDASSSRLPDKRSGIVLCVPRVDDDWPFHLGSESYLSGKRPALRFARGVVVMVVEAALSDRHRRTADKLAELWDIPPFVETGRIVGMDSRRSENETGIGGCVLSGERRCVERLAYTDDGCRARIAGAGDYRVAVAGEGRVREVGVAVDEDLRAPAWRGHFRSIQRSTGAAT